ncbi:MAG: hypothetical protein DI585_03275 [Pseudomonas fluorescens]|nr:MAG: hypothetical protein DI585_03275 [Pseudomonas fluorescens]
MLLRMKISPFLRLSLLASATVLMSCSYSPLYAPQAGASSAAHRMQVGSVGVDLDKRNVGERRVAQTVSQQLKLDFPNAGADMDTLTVAIDEEETTLAVQRTATIQRAEIHLTAHVNLQDADGKTLLTTSLSTSAPYNVESTPLSTETGKTYSRQTAARNLAAEISRRVYLYYSTHKMPESKPLGAATPKR